MDIRLLKAHSPSMVATEFLRWVYWFIFLRSLCRFHFGASFICAQWQWLGGMMDEHSTWIGFYFSKDWDTLQMSIISGKRELTGTKTTCLCFVVFTVRHIVFSNKKRMRFYVFSSSVCRSNAIEGANEMEMLFNRSEARHKTEKTLISWAPEKKVQPAFVSHQNSSRKF